MPQRITYSFVPDGTSIGGIPSNLQATLNARFSTSNWMDQFAKAAAVWQKVANVNFVLVSDNGAPIGVSGNQQGDPRFGDIRIGGYAQQAGQLAFAFLPSPFNGGTTAGDIFFNTTQSWQTNGTSTYDLMTVAIHELGHALGMGHATTDSTAAMWPTYTGAKQAVSNDDIGGIQSIYNARPDDSFDAGGNNDTNLLADDVTPYLNSSSQLTLANLDMTPSPTRTLGDVDWYKIAVPSTTTGTMVVKMQSSGLSVLAPSLAVLNAAGTTTLGQQTSQAYGDAVSVTLAGVKAGQVYLIKAKGATTGSSGYGAYALQVNLGSSPLSPVPIPAATVAMQADLGGGTQPLGSTSGVDTAGGSDAASGAPGNSSTNGGPGAQAGGAEDGAPGASGSTPASENARDGGTIVVGDLSGIGDDFMNNGPGSPDLVPERARTQSRLPNGSRDCPDALSGGELLVGVPRDAQHGHDESRSTSDASCSDSTIIVGSFRPVPSAPVLRAAARTNKDGLSAPPQAYIRPRALAARRALDQFIERRWAQRPA